MSNTLAEVKLQTNKFLSVKKLFFLPKSPKNKIDVNNINNFFHLCFSTQTIPEKKIKNTNSHENLIVLIGKTIINNYSTNMYCVKKTKVFCQDDCRLLIQLSVFCKIKLKKKIKIIDF